MTAVLDQASRFEPQLEQEPSRAGEFRLVVESERVRLDKHGQGQMVDREGRLERLGPDGTWRPYANNSFRARLARPGLDLGELAGLLTDRWPGCRPAPAPEPEEEAPMQTAHEGSNGVTKRTRRLYTQEEKADLAGRFQAAPDKKAFAAEVGVQVTMLYRWARGRAVNANPATATAPDRELDVLRQLLELPADARERIVAYLTSRGR